RLFSCAVQQSPDSTLLAGEALLVIGLGRAGDDDAFLPFRPGETRPLYRFGPAIVERLEALLPRRPVQHVEVPLIDVGRQEEVQRLRLADIGRAVGRELDDPALVDLESGAEHQLLVVGQEIEVLDRTFVFKDRGPYRRGVVGGFPQYLLEGGVVHREGARQRLVRVDVARDRFNAGGRAT